MITTLESIQVALEVNCLAATARQNCRPVSCDRGFYCNAQEAHAPRTGWPVFFRYASKSDLAFDLKFCPLSFLSRRQYPDENAGAADRFGECGIPARNRKDTGHNFLRFRVPCAQQARRMTRSPQVSRLPLPQIRPVSFQQGVA
jgi:hypothetical protein